MGIINKHLRRSEWACRMIKYAWIIIDIVVGYLVADIEILQWRLIVDTVRK